MLIRGELKCEKRKWENMTLEEYLKIAHTKLDNFAKAWIEDAKRCPANYPMEMDLGEWEEQEASFRDLSQ